VATYILIIGLLVLGVIAIGLRYHRQRRSTAYDLEGSRKAAATHDKSRPTFFGGYGG